MVTGDRSPTVDAVFEKNDFDSIYGAYFESLIAAGQVSADPSGWSRTEPGSLLTAAPDLRPELMGHYVIDNRKLIASEKEPLLAMLGAWDGRSYAYEEATLVPSISTASLAVLFLMRSVGVREVRFETPAYYATIEQADSIGLACRRVPTWRDRNYRWDGSEFRAAGPAPVAVWLTQPRYALGIDQDVDAVESLASVLRPGDFIVIDETADQGWPTRLHGIREASGGPNLIRIRGIMKPLGLNSLRLAVILHQMEWRAPLQEFQWLVGAALDRYSLQAAAAWSAPPGLFQAMLASARGRVAAIRRRLSALSGSIELSPMDNGYLGVAELDWSGSGAPRQALRSALLAFCRERRMPVTLGAAMLFALEPDRERVRLNYFMPQMELESAVLALREFAAQLGALLTSPSPR